MSEELKRENSRLILSIFLIAAGIFWLIKATGFYFEFPDFFWEQIFSPLRHVFNKITGFIFSWQMILILVGLVLMAGNRKSGLILVVIGGIFIIPEMFVVSGLSASLIIPVTLIVTGVALVAGKTG